MGALNPESAESARKFFGEDFPGLGSPEITARMNRTLASWVAMLNRCYNPLTMGYKNYGGRGIYACDRWHQFRFFLADMGWRPEGMTLDRIDNDGIYSPDNCRWATPKEQARNSRIPKWEQLGSEKLTRTDLADLAGVSGATITRRLARGLTPAQAVDGASIRKNKLTLTQAKQIKARIAAGEMDQDIARGFQVSRSMVSGIRRGEYWKDA